MQLGALLVLILQLLHLILVLAIQLLFRLAADPLRDLRRQMSGHVVRDSDSYFSRYALCDFGGRAFDGLLSDFLEHYFHQVLLGGDLFVDLECRDWRVATRTGVRLGQLLRRVRRRRCIS